MDYIKEFSSHTEYEAYINGSNVLLPNVSVCQVEEDVHYNPYIHDYSQDYLTFEALQSGTFKFSGTTSANTLQYSLDDGETWTTLAHNTNTPTIAAGSNILWKGSGLTTTMSSGIGKFSSTGTFNVKGNVMSLHFGNDFSGQTSLSGKKYAYRGLFNGCTKIVSAENLSLPATALTNTCYAYMFSGCTSLTTPPELPATALTEACYADMFRGCTSLTTAPSLPATTLAEDCYSYMFNGCTSLTTAPTLPAMTLASSCYSYMFSNCGSLTSAPALPATTLASSCYENMFSGCSGLTAAPVLPATTLANYCYQCMFSGCSGLTAAPVLPATTLTTWCYQGMFRGCSGLTSAPELPATTLVSHCYQSMFEGCTSLTAAPELPATTLVSDCYNFMFENCTNLNYIKAMFTTTPSMTYTQNWVRGVKSTGTFVKNSTATWNVTGVNGIPTGWTVQTASS